MFINPISVNYNILKKPNNRQLITPQKIMTSERYKNNYEKGINSFGISFCRQTKTDTLTGRNMVNTNKTRQMEQTRLIERGKILKIISESLHTESQFVLEEAKQDIKDSPSSQTETPALRCVTKYKNGIPIRKIYFMPAVDEPQIYEVQDGIEVVDGKTKIKTRYKYVNNKLSSISKGVTTDGTNNQKRESVNRLFDYYNNKILCVSEGCKFFPDGNAKVNKVFNYNIRTGELEGILTDISKSSDSDPVYKKIFIIK